VCLQKCGEFTQPIDKETWWEPNREASLHWASSAALRDPRRTGGRFELGTQRLGTDAGRLQVLECQAVR
jgi:hypothetical protein